MSLVALIEDAGLEEIPQGRAIPPLGCRDCAAKAKEIERLRQALETARDGMDRLSIAVERQREATRRAMQGAHT